MFQTELGRIGDPVERFFAIARERQTIFLKKESGAPRPWTEDAIFNNFKFTNVFREQDKTTKWFRENIRDRLKNDPVVLLATVLFRWFNRIEIGDIIFNQQEQRSFVPWDRFLQEGDGKYLENVIRHYAPKGPWVTGAYLITSKPNMDKLAGMCSIVEDFNKGRYPCKFENFADASVTWGALATTLINNPGRITLQEIWAWLKGVPFQGPFHAYEVVSDLRHTALLDHAPDINTWANAGPGAQRGLARIHNRPLNSRVPAAQAVEEMRNLLEKSRRPSLWPHRAGEFPYWELREVEHWLCEFDKYMRVYESDGKRKPRSIYK